MKSDPEGSSLHLEMMSNLARQLTGRGIAVYSHTYNYLAFGSWEIVVGTRKRRVRLTWDGKESFLDAASCALGYSQSKPEWKHLESQTLDSGDPKTVFKIGSEMILRGCAV